MQKKGVFSFPADAVWLALPPQCPKDNTVPGGWGISHKQHCFKMDKGFSSDRILSVSSNQVPVSLHRGTLYRALDAVLQCVHSFVRVVAQDDDLVEGLLRSSADRW